MSKPLEILYDEKGVALGEWGSEKVGESGLFRRLTILAANEWHPLVFADRELQVARAVARLDMEAAEFHDSPIHNSERPMLTALEAMLRLVRTRSLVIGDPETCDMLEAFGIRFQTSEGA